MTALKLVQAELQGLVGRAVFLHRCRFYGWLRSGCIPDLWCFTWLLPVLFGIYCHFLGVEMKPFNGLVSCCENAHVVHPGNEVQDIAAMLAFAETIPNVFADTHPELGRVAALVDRTRAATRPNSG